MVWGEASENFGGGGGVAVRSISFITLLVDKDIMVGVHACPVSATELTN